MSIRNHNWLNAQATRRYPLDDNATGTGDDGTRLKDDILVDLHLRWPRIAGQYAFLGGLTVTDNIITAVILAADDVETAENFTPLASVTAVQPVNRHQFINVEPLYPGTGGFVAFGDVKENFSIRFSTPRQGLLAPKVARPYDQLPIPTMRKFGRADGLVGLVKILPGPDVEIVKETVALDDQEKDAMVIRLLNPTSQRNVLSDYIGPCGKRPESRNCARDGVETINGVGPDCDGNLEIEFRGLIAGPYASCGSEGAGVTLDQSLGIDDVCTAQSPERFGGSDYCIPDSSQSSASLSSEQPPPPEPSSSSSAGDGGSSEAIPCEELPFLDCFDTSLHPSWITKIGTYAFVESDSPGETDCLTPAICVDRWSGFSSFSSVQSGSSSVSQSASSASSASSAAANPPAVLQVLEDSGTDAVRSVDFGNITAGNTLVLVAGNNSSTERTYTPTTNQGDTFVELSKTVVNGRVITIFWCESCTGGATVATMTLDANANNGLVGYELEPAQLDTNSSFQNSSTGSSLFTSPAPGITTSAGATVIGGIALNAASDPVTAPTDWTLVSPTDTAVEVFSAYLETVDGLVDDRGEFGLGGSARLGPGAVAAFTAAPVPETPSIVPWVRTNRFAVPWSSESSYSCDLAIDQAVRLNDSSRRNALVWEDCGVDSSDGKRVTTQLKLTNNASRRNGGVILNYHLVDPFTNPRIEYFVAQINQNDNRVELVRFNGATLVIENFATPAIPFSFDDWYQIVAEATVVGSNVQIDVEVSNVSTPSWPTVSFSLLTSRWGDSDGHYGIHTNRAITDFSFWRLEDA